MICKIGWEFLTSDKKVINTNAGKKPGEAGNGIYQDVKDKLFYPITFPVTTGPGTISVLFTLSAHSATENVTNYLISTAAILLSVIAMCILVYIFYLNTDKIIHYLGANGEFIINRITAFLVFCVGLQIAVTGIKTIVAYHTGTLPGN